MPSYLNNLFRLGMAWFSREAIRDPLRYQGLEAQPDVLDAIHSVRQAKVIRRSVHLTPFGEDFCRVCLSSEAGALEGLPGHSAPKDIGGVGDFCADLPRDIPRPLPHDRSDAPGRSPARRLG